MIKIISCFLTGLLGVQISLSQTIYPGYYVDQLNDTVHTRFEIPISFDINLMNELIIVSEQGKSQVPVANINFIYIPNIGAYERKTADLGNYQLENQFLEVLVKGKASLYYNDFNKDERYIIETEEKGMILLSNKERITEKDGKYYKQDRPYSHVVAFLLRDCPRISYRIHKTNYDHPSLISLLNKYNNCVGSSNTLVNKPKVASIMEIGPVAVYGIARFTYKNIDRVGVSIGDVNFSSQSDMNAGIFFNIFPFKSNRKYALGFTGVYHMFDFKSVGDYFSEGTVNRKISDMEISFTEILLCPSLTRFFRIGNRSNLSFGLEPYFGLPLEKHPELTARSEVLIENGSISKISKEISHTSSYGFNADIGYQFAYHKFKSISLIGQFSYGTINLFADPNPVYRIGLGLKLDLY